MYTYTVTDGYGETSQPATVSFSLEEPNQAPDSFSLENQEFTLEHDGTPGGTMMVTLDGCAATDPEDDPLTDFVWMSEDQILGDGCSIEAEAFLGSNEYVLTVTDIYGAEGTITASVTLLAESNDTPVFADTDTSFEFTLERDGSVETNSNTVELCSNASDSDGDDLSYQWYKDELELEGETGPCTTQQVTGGLNGSFGEYDYSDGDTVHSYSVTVTDSYFASNSLDFTVTVAPETNQSPVAQTDSYISLQPEHDGQPGGTATAHIRSVNSFDLDSDDLTCSWSSDLSFDSATDMFGLPIDNADSSCEFLLPIAYDSANPLHTLTLTICDIYDSCDSDELIVEVLPEQNAAPVVSSLDCTVSPMAHDGLLGGNLDVICSGSATDSDMYDDLYFSYQWCYDGECYDGVSRDQALVIPVDDTYQTELTFVALDAYGAEGESTILLTGVEPNEVPIASLSELSEEQLTLPHDGHPGGELNLILSAESSSDADGDALTYVWVSGDVEVTTSVDTLEFNRVIDELYTPFTVSVTASDIYGAESTSEITVQAIEPNQAPVANAGEDLFAAIPHDGVPGSGECVTLDPSLSVDPEGDDMIFTWAPVSNSRSTEVCLTEGVYTFELTATDAYGASSTDEVMVTINPEALLLL